jgi:hypothetical protein
MQAKPTRRSTDLTGYPGLVVVYLGFRVSTWRGVLSLLGIGRTLRSINHHKPDGLLLHEPIVYGFRHIGMRQYWRDIESLEEFIRSGPHKIWWQAYSRDTKGSGFWHEAYRKAGGMEGLYMNMPYPIGFGVFAPALEPDGRYKTSRERLSA